MFDTHDPFGCMVLGILLYDDFPGSPRDHEAGIRALRQSCEAGEVRACAMLDQAQPDTADKPAP